MVQIGKLEAAAEQKSEEIVLLKRDLNHVTSSLTELTKRHVRMIDDNNDLRMQVQNMKEDQKIASQQVKIKIVFNDDFFPLILASKSIIKCRR